MIDIILEIVLIATTEEVEVDPEVQHEEVTVEILETN
jgi:hypothetical protein